MREVLEDNRELIKNKIENSKPEIPKDYHVNLQTILRELPEQGRRSSFWNVGKVAIIVIGIFCLGTTGVYATKNYRISRMEEMSEQEVKAYTEDAAESTADADSFSRELTDAEQKRRNQLDTLYVSEGKIPEEKLLQVESKADVIDDRLCFVPNESKFYLPERELTDEELLQLIDFYYKRDYSVTISAEAEKGELIVSEEKYLTEQEMVSVARKYIENLFDTNVSEWTYTYDTGNVTEYGCHMHIILKNNSRESYDLLLNAETGELQQVQYNGDNVYGTGITVDEESYKNIYTNIKADVFEKLSPNSEIQNAYFYYGVNPDNSLKRGWVKYVLELPGGDGYVVNYSCSLKKVYFILHVNDVESYEKEFIDASLVRVKVE